MFVDLELVVVVVVWGFFVLWQAEITVSNTTRNGFVMI